LPGAILMLDVGRAIGSLDTLSLSLSRTSWVILRRGGEKL
jgi:hypothetical protein